MAGSDWQRGNVKDLAAYRAGGDRSLSRLRRDDSAAAALLGMVAAERGVGLPDLLDAKRGPAHVAAARQLAMYLVNTMLGRTMKEVGGIFGRDRTTVAYACRLVEDRRDEDDAAFDAELARLERAAHRLTAGFARAKAEVRHARR